SMNSFANPRLLIVPLLLALPLADAQTGLAPSTSSPGEMDSRAGHPIHLQSVDLVVEGVLETRAPGRGSDGPDIVLQATRAIYLMPGSLVRAGDGAPGLDQSDASAAVGGSGGHGGN